jgi:DNA-binding GntR family transcriptional regulator
MQRSATGTSLTHDVYQRLRADLLACRVRPGTQLRLGALCRELGVSLSAVREALSRLTAEGLVTAEPQRGFRAAPISAEDLRDLTEARVEIEQLCLRRAIAQGGLAWEEALLAVHHRLSRTPMQEPDDPGLVAEAWAEAHRGFHEALVAACDSAWLLRIRALLFAQSERYRRLSLPLARAERDLGQEHRAILEAALARDADAACTALADHLRLTSRILLEA